MTSVLGLEVLNLPSKYCRYQSETDKLEVLLHKSWIRNLLRYHRVPDFIFHERFSDDEVSALFKQGEHFGPLWCHSIIKVISKNDKLVVPLPRARFSSKQDSKLSLSQILQYVAQANHKNLWKEAYKKYNYDCWKPDSTDDSCIQFMNYNDLIKEIITRMYGLTVFKLGDMQVSKDSSFQAHSNILPAVAAFETNNSFFIIQEADSDFTLFDCMSFSPAKMSSSNSAPLFLIYQLLQLMRHLHDMGLVLGDITLQDIHIDDNLWIQVSPRLEDNICEKTNWESFERAVNKTDSPLCNQDELGELSVAWSYGALSNYDYLCALNRLAGRRLSDPTRHYVMPWVSDLMSRSGSNWRDLTKSKFRITKGDCQLDLTFQVEPNSNQVAHHVPEVLSEITYYVYLSRVTPRSLLCKYVRSQWVPAEYPVSIQRLQEWTPDECIPEFYSDPSVFKSIHSDLGDLEVPAWASSPQDFIAHHRSMLESHHVSARIHHWIDLTFGYKLSGSAAVKAKNVCLHLVDGHTKLTKSGVVQLFKGPHPHRTIPSPYWGKTPPRIHPYDKRKLCPDEDCQSSGLEDEEPPRNPSTLSRFMSRSRTSLISPLMEGNQVQIALPKDFNPVIALLSVETLHNFNKANLNKLTCEVNEPIPNEITYYKQLVAGRRVREMQVLACLIVEIFLAPELRVFGNGVGDLDFSRRLEICYSVVKQNMDLLPKCVHPIVKLLLQVGKETNGEIYPCVTVNGSPPPSPHQLLQPLLSPIPFPSLFPTLYSVLSALRNFENTLAESDIELTEDINIYQRLSEMKVKNLVQNIEKISEDGGPCLLLLVPYFVNLISNRHTDVIAAWYLFDYVARGLGPKSTTQLLLDPLVKLYDWERAEVANPRTLHKRIKLYHRSFLLKLIVRFGLQVFLDFFIVPLVEAVGGYHDMDAGKTPNNHLDFTEVEEEIEIEITSPLSPLDEDSSVGDTDKNSAITTKEHVDAEPEVFLLEDDSIDDGNRKGPKSAKSLQNLLIDNIDSHSIEEKDQITAQADENLGTKFIRDCSDIGSWHSRRSFSSVHQYDDYEHSKVCHVAGESVQWLSHRLGPVLSAKYLCRNLLRMMALCYSGQENLTEDKTGRLPGDQQASSVLECLRSIANLYGEQLIVLQYLPHMIELILHSKRKLNTNLEGGMVGCLVLLHYILDIISDSTFADILQDMIVRSILHPTLRLMSSSSMCMPSGVTGRRALACKLVLALSALVSRAAPAQRILLLQTLQRFFLAFSKALNLSPDASCRSYEGQSELGITIKTKLKDDVLESPPLSLTPCETETQRHKASEELRETMCAELAYKSYAPFANFFGESLMEQSLRNYSLIKELCNEYITEKEENQIPDCYHIELSSLLHPPSETGLHVGSFGNVILVGNRIDLQESFGKSSSPVSIEEPTSNPSNKKSENMTRHLRGNWVAYWEHEIGRNSKDSRLNIKQIKLQTFCGHTNSVKHIIPLANENSFMSASRDKTVRLWSLRSQGDGSSCCSPQWTYTGHRKSILGCGFSDRCRLTVSTDSVVHVWDPWVGRSVGCLDPSSVRPSPPPINTLITLPAPSSLALCATTETTVKALDLRTCSFINELKISVGPGTLIRCLVVSPSCSWLAVGQASGIITVLDLKMGTVISNWKAHDAEILQLVAVDDQTLISSSLDQLVYVWNVADGRNKSLLKGPTEPVHCLEVCQEELISGTTSNRIGVHTCLDGSADSYSSSRLRSDTFKGVLTSMSLLPLNRLLLLGADSGNITLIC